MRRPTRALSANTSMTMPLAAGLFDFSMMRFSSVDDSRMPSPMLFYFRSFLYGWGSPRFAVCTTAFASGCNEWSSIAARGEQRLLGKSVSQFVISRKRGSPSVSVPVLSKNIVVICDSVSSAAGFFTMIFFLDALLSPPRKLAGAAMSNGTGWPSRARRADSPPIRKRRTPRRR